MVKRSWVVMPHIVNRSQKQRKLFDRDPDEADIKKQRHEARRLRESQWWKRRVAKGVCYYCGRTVSPKELTMDHIVPIALGGKSTKGNVAASCKECNNSKKNLLPMEWDQYLNGIHSE